MTTTSKHEKAINELRQYWKVVGNEARKELQKTELPKRLRVYFKQYLCDIAINQGIIRRALK
jgi:hypothetical protein